MRGTLPPVPLFRANLDHVGVFAFMESNSESNRDSFYLLAIVKFQTMAKKIFAEYKLYSANDNLSARWYISFYKDGKRILKYGNINQFDTIEARYAAAYELAKQLDTNPAPKPSQLLQKIAAHLATRQPFLRKKTFQTLCSKINTFENFLRLHPKATVLEFFEYLNSKVHPVTYNDYVEKFRRIWQDIGEQFADIQKHKRAQSTPAMFFNTTELAFIRPAIRKVPDLWLFVQLLYYCFIRPSELRQLRLADVLLDEKKIRIRSSVSKNGLLQYVKIPDVFLDELLRLLPARPPHAYIFGNGVKPLGANTMARKHQKILRACGFDTKVYKLYSWKHTGAVAAVKAGIHIKELQIQLRHHSLDQVNDYLRMMGILDLSDLGTKFPKL
jgi:integrase